MPGPAVVDGPGVLRVGDVELFEDDLQRAGAEVFGGHVVEDVQVEVGGLAQPGGRVGVEAEEVVVAVVEVNGGAECRTWVFLRFVW